MGYSTSPETLISRLSLLGPLASGQPCKWTTEPGDERLLAYQIREALHIAQLYQGHWREHIGGQTAEMIEDLAREAPHFTISHGSVGEVIASMRKRPKVSVSVLESQPEELRFEPQGDSVPPVEKVISHIVKYGAGQSKVVFEGMTLSEPQLRALHTWSVSQGWLMFPSSDGLTMRPFSEEYESLAFNPEEDL